MAPRKAGKNVSSPKYRKFWDGSRPQVWIVAPKPASAARSQSQGRRQVLPSPFPPAQIQAQDPDLQRLPPEESVHSEPCSIQVGGSLWSEDTSNRSRPSQQLIRAQEPRSTPQLAPPALNPPRVSRAAGSDHLSAPVQRGQVLPPWSAERANRDRPPWELYARKQLEYRQILDDQSADQANQRQRRRQEVLELEKQSIPSLATKTHVWEKKDTESNAAAIMEEQLALAAVKRGQEHERKKMEEETTRAFLKQAAEERAERYVAVRLRQREEVSVLTHEWTKVAEEKKRQKDELKRAELREEQEAVQRLTQGWVPPRRLRKPCHPHHNEEFHGAKTAR